MRLSSNLSMSRTMFKMHCWFTFFSLFSFFFWLQLEKHNVYTRNDIAQNGISVTSLYYLYTNRPGYVIGISIEHLSTGHLILLAFSLQFVLQCADVM